VRRPGGGGGGGGGLVVSPAAEAWWWACQRWISIFMFFKMFAVGVNMAHGKAGPPVVNSLAHLLTFVCRALCETHGKDYLPCVTI
jgi:hypothetical protein